jgi:hypothetical protein
MDCDRYLTFAKNCPLMAHDAFTQFPFCFNLVYVTQWIVEKSS